MQRIIVLFVMGVGIGIAISLPTPQPRKSFQEAFFSECHHRTDVDTCLMGVWRSYYPGDFR